MHCFIVSLSVWRNQIVVQWFESVYIKINIYIISWSHQNPTTIPICLHKVIRLDKKVSKTFILKWVAHRTSLMVGQSALPNKMVDNYHGLKLVSKFLVLKKDGSTIQQLGRNLSHTIITSGIFCEIWHQDNIS